MNPTRMLGTALICSLGISLSAAIKPHFLGRDSAWRANDIVEVEETAVRGTFAVINVWKGSLLAGQSIRVPGLVEWQDPDRKIVVRDDPPGPSTPLRTTHLVLFLTCKMRSEFDSADPVWVPATLWNTWQASFVWIENEKVYAYEQGVFVNGQPATLHEQPDSKVSFQETILKFAAEREAFDHALKIDDPTRRAKAIAQFFGSANPSASIAAFQEIERVGREALPALRASLREPALLPHSGEILHAMATVDGADAGPDLTTYLEADVAYWTAVQPHLTSGWWNRDLQNMRQLDDERSHYAGDLRSLEGLIAIGFAPARSSITRFCNTWSKLPPLDANSTVDQIIEQCQIASKRFPTD